MEVIISLFPAWASVKKKIAFTNLQTTGSAGGVGDKSSFIWIELKMGYAQEMPMSHLSPVPHLQLGTGT